MKAISTEGYETPRNVDAGSVPLLQWLNIEDLLVDPSYQRPIDAKGRKHVDRIASSFCWSCFAPVIASPVAGGKFAIIDGQHRTTAASLVGFKAVPCQIVIAAGWEQAAAFKAINGVTTVITPMALQAAAVMAREPWAVKVAQVCAAADVEILRYPLPSNKQGPGQTMAVGALNDCLKRYGSDTLITALQCVTQTGNNRPGMLSARIIRALCIVMHQNHSWRDSGLALLEAFDQIDLSEIQAASAVDAITRKIGRIDAIAAHIRLALERQMTSTPSAIYLVAAE